MGACRVVSARVCETIIDFKLSNSNFSFLFVPPFFFGDGIPDRDTTNDYDLPFLCCWLGIVLSFTY